MFHQLEIMQHQPLQFIFLELENNYGSFFYYNNLLIVSLLNICFQGMPKMLSNQRGNRTRSKSGGCPRLAVFPSYPFHCNFLWDLIFPMNVFVWVGFSFS